MESIEKLREFREKGNVSWLRDFNHALERAQGTNKPLLLLSEGMVGCSTRVNFVEDLLEHPLMAELINEQFVPVAIVNNRAGSDTKNLQRFNDPSTKNPVVYFLAPDGAPLIGKTSQNLTPLAFYEKISAALAFMRLAAPKYFELLRGDLLIDTEIAARAVFETPCFWSGETSLAQHPAVIATNAGWIGGEEVVEVRFDARAATFEELENYARDQLFTPARNDGIEFDEQTQYYLSQSAFRFLPLSRAQRTKINLAIPYRRNPEQFLSPRQLAWLQCGELTKKSEMELYRKDVRDAWALAARVTPQT